MVSAPRTTWKSLSDEEMREYLESVRNGAPGNMQKFLEAAQGTLTWEEGEEMIKYVQQMRDESLHGG